jgi:hypothetical protein
MNIECIKREYKDDMDSHFYQLSPIDKLLEYTINFNSLVSLTLKGKKYEG